MNPDKKKGDKFEFFTGLKSLTLMSLGNQEVPFNLGEKRVDGSTANRWVLRTKKRYGGKQLRSHYRMFAGLGLDGNGLFKSKYAALTGHN